MLPLSGCVREVGKREWSKGVTHQLFEEVGSSLLPLFGCVREVGKREREGRDGDSERDGEREGLGGREGGREGGRVYLSARVREHVSVSISYSRQPLTCSTKCDGKAENRGRADKK